MRIAFSLSLLCAFGNDIVAIDANRSGTDFLIVSRGGNFVFRASRDGCRLTLNPPDVVRFQTGNLPNGVVISRDGTRAYVNNEVDISVTRIDLEAGSVIPGNLPSGTPPAPGTFEHAVLVGKLAFFTALGIPDEDNFGTPIRRIDPVANRGKASRDAWSGCASCHPDGLTDNVTWIFGTGPRSTIDMSAFFSKLNPADQRISNWSAVMGSVTDFNNNSRGVQGGIGFAGNPPNPNIYPHGLTEGASEALDLMSLWVQTIRPIIMPNAGNRRALNNGRTVFANNCASCHGGPKWTKSQVIYRDNPAFDAAVNGVPVDPGVINAAAQIRCFTLDPAIDDCIDDPDVLRFLENVGTFNVNDPLEVRGQAPANGQLALGGLGFNVPSLLGIGYTAPYLHHGEARSLEAVFRQHRLGNGNDTIADVLSSQQVDNLIVFLSAVDGSTEPFDSETDAFLDSIGE